MFLAWPKVDLVELSKFGGVGVLNTLVGLGIIYGLKLFLGWGDVAANLTGYLICIFLGFVLNGRWTFKKSILKIRHFTGYFVVAGAAYLMNLFAVLTAINLLHVSGNMAQLIGVPFFTLTSYVLNKLFVFKDVG